MAHLIQKNIRQFQTVSLAYVCKAVKQLYNFVFCIHFLHPLFRRWRAVKVCTLVAGIYSNSYFCHFIYSLTSSFWTLQRGGWCLKLTPSLIYLDKQSLYMPVTLAPNSEGMPACSSSWCFLIKESMFLFLYFSICSLPLVYKFRTHLAPQLILYIWLETFPPFPLPSLQANQSKLSHPGVAVGLDFWSWDLAVFPPAPWI